MGTVRKKPVLQISERHGQTEGLKATNAREKGRIHVQNNCTRGQRKDHWQVVQKGNKDTHHSNREGTGSIEEGFHTKLESSEDQIKTAIHTASYNS